MTIEEALREVQKALKGVSDSPEIDAQRLVLEVLHKDEASWLITHSGDELFSNALQRLKKLVARRQQGEPLAYVLEKWDFYGRTFAVTPDVLVPRPSTERLVSTALQVIDALYKKLGRPLVVADLGTGSGVVAITLALESQVLSHVYATDISAAALAVGQRNATTYGLDRKITFLEGDMMIPLQNLPIDLLVSNPPYVPTEELNAAGASVETKGLAFEPRVALDGGPYGQRFTEAIKKSGMPAVMEGLNGDIEVSSLDLEA